MRGVARSCCLQSPDFWKWFTNEYKLMIVKPVCSRLISSPKRASVLERADTMTGIRGCKRPVGSNLFANFYPWYGRCCSSITIGALFEFYYYVVQQRPDQWNFLAGNLLSILSLIKWLRTEWHLNRKPHHRTREFTDVDSAEDHPPLSAEE